LERSKAFEASERSIAASIFTDGRALVGLSRSGDGEEALEKFE
jgi:hypothetical protein